MYTSPRYIITKTIRIVHQIIHCTPDYTLYITRPLHSRAIKAGNTGWMFSIIITPGTQTLYLVQLRRGGGGFFIFGSITRAGAPWHTLRLESYVTSTQTYSDKQRTPGINRVILQGKYRCFQFTPDFGNWLEKTSIIILITEKQRNFE